MKAKLLLMLFLVSLSLGVFASEHQPKEASCSLTKVYRKGGLLVIPFIFQYKPKI